MIHKREAGKQSLLLTPPLPHPLEIQPYLTRFQAIISIQSFNLKVTSATKR